MRNYRVEAIFIVKANKTEEVRKIIKEKLSLSDAIFIKIEKGGGFKNFPFKLSKTEGIKPRFLDAISENKGKISLSH